MKKKWQDPSFLVDIVQAFIAAVAAVILALDSTGLLNIPWLQSNLLNLIFVAICVLLVSSVLERRFTFRSFEEKIDIKLSGIEKQLTTMEKNTPGSASADIFLKDRGALPRIEIELQDAKDVIIIGKSLVGLVSSYYGFFRKLARQECKFKFVLEDPSIYTTGDSNEKNIRQSLDRLSRIQDELPDAIEIRLLPTTIYYTMVCIDSKTAKGRIRVELYNYRIDATDRPHFVLSPVDDPKWYKFYEEQFSKLWNESKPYLSKTRDIH
jgi:hypothetical protein